MRRSLILRLLFLLIATISCPRLWSQDLSGMDELLNDYFQALKYESTEAKMEEVDYMISTVPDSAIMRSVALAAYSHFVSSPVMGDEAVAIHIFDKWFDSGVFGMSDDIEMMNARIFAEWNRPTLIGKDAPVITVMDAEGDLVTLPLKGRTSILYFYDTSCAKCKVQSMLLGYFFRENTRECDFYAIYVGDDRDAWEEYVRTQLDIEGENVTVHHLWDPEMDSGMLKTYGLLQTPRMLLVSAHGDIIGRSLDVPALSQLMDYADIIRNLFERCPEGSTLEHLPISARTVNSRISRRLDKDNLKDGIAALPSKETDLAQVRGSKAWIFFYSPTCRHCQDQMKGMLDELEAYRKKHPFASCKAVFVNVDEIVSDSELLAEALFDTFDLSVLPYVISVDRKGRITGKYLEF